MIVAALRAGFNGSPGHMRPPGLRLATSVPEASSVLTSQTLGGVRSKPRDGQGHVTQERAGQAVVVRTAGSSSVRLIDLLQLHREKQRSRTQRSQTSTPKKTRGASAPQQVTVGGSYQSLNDRLACWLALDCDQRWSAGLSRTFRATVVSLRL